MSHQNWLYVIIFALTVVLYGNTIGHDYALDDAIVVTENVYVQQGIAGIPDLLSEDTFMGFFQEEKKLVSGGRYRPLSLLTFALEYEFFGLNPHISHGVNIVLYAFSVLLLLLVFQELLTSYIHRPWLNIATISVLLFLVHPVHTEVVANIKGRDEILTFLFSLLAFRSVLHDLRRPRNRFLGLSALFFVLALLAKENAITFLFIIPLSLFFFTKTPAKVYLRVVAPLLLSSVVFLMIRGLILGFELGNPPGELMNNPFLGMSVGEKYATILYTWGMYLKLLIYPHPLTYDYYPYHIPVMNWSMPVVWLTALAYLALAWLALTRWRNKSIDAYGIWFYLVSLSIVSNLFFPVGTFMNERFVYIASYGFTLVLAYGLSNLIFQHFPEKRARVLSSSLVLALVLLASCKTIDRNRAWKNDYTLFTTDVQVSAESAKANCTAGGKLLEKAKETDDEVLRDSLMKESLRCLRKSVSIHPTYRDALLLLGNAHYAYQQDLDSTILYYQRILRSSPNYQVVYDNLELVLRGYQQVDQKIAWYEDFHQINPTRYEILYHLGNLYGKHKNNLDKALPYLQKAVKVNPSSKRAWKDLGVAWAIQGDWQKALQANQKALQLAPDDPQVHVNLGLVYRTVGEHQQAQYHFQQAQSLKNQ